jgi:hypothetical protein
MRELKLAKVSLALFIVAVACGIAWADPAAIINPSFESPEVPQGLWSSNGLVSGWTCSNNASCGVWYPEDAHFSSIPDGNQVMWLNGGSLSQQLANVFLTAGSAYTLSAYVGHRDDSWYADIDIWDSNYSLQLLAGSTVIASGSGYDPLLGNFGLLTLPTYTAAVDDALIGQPLSIVFTNSAVQTNFDKVSLDVSTSMPPAVPEPTSIILLGSGLSIIALASWRRKK